MNSLKVDLQSWQEKFLRSPFKFKFLKSAWATGKTLALILAGITESETYDDNLGVIFRKEYTDLRDSTVKDFESYTGLKVDSTRNVKVGKSLIMFRHLEELNNLQNMNLGWFGIEQGEELLTDNEFTMLWGRLRRQNSSRKGYVISNAKGHNWIYRYKIEGIYDPETREKLDAHYAAKTKDNAVNLPPDYLRTLEILKEKKPKTYARMVENSDEEDDLTDIIIQPSWIEQAKHTKILISGEVRRVVSIDVARGGGDLSEFYALENCIDRGTEEHNTRNSMELVGRAQLFAKKVWGHSQVAYAVDEIGVGAGVADRLIELGHEVILVNAAQKLNVMPPYYNRRSEILGTAAVLFQEGKVQINSLDTELAEQLSWTKWKPLKSTGILQAESKDDIRATFGRSPDKADAFLNGLWALNLVQPTNGRIVNVQEKGWVHPHFRKENQEHTVAPHLMYR